MTLQTEIYRAGTRGRETADYGLTNQGVTVYAMTILMPSVYAERAAFACSVPAPTAPVVTWKVNVVLDIANVMAPAFRVLAPSLPRPTHAALPLIGVYVRPSRAKPAIA